MILLIKPKENTKYLKEKIDNFLAVRGLDAKKAKTNLVKPTQDFDFFARTLNLKRIIINSSVIIQKIID